MADEGSFGDYYGKWDKFAQDVEGEDEDEDSKSPSYPSLPSRPTGYEFRSGHRTPFPEIAVADGETDDAAAFRVANECLQRGREAFALGTVWGTQSSVDCWGQGLLALERTKNLRKYRKARVEGGTASEADFALEAKEAEDLADLAAMAEKGDDAGDAADGEPGAGGGSSGSGSFVRRIPGEEEVKASQLTLRLNVAQALLKLKDFERCIRYCDGALDLDADSKKALWRKAQAVWGIRNPGLARATLERLLDLDPGNAAAVALLREIAGEEARKKARRLGADAASAKQAAKAAKEDEGKNVAARTTQMTSQEEATDAANTAYWAAAAARAAVEAEVSEEEEEEEAPLSFRERLLLLRDLCCKRRPKDKDL